MYRKLVRLLSVLLVGIILSVDILTTYASSINYSSQLGTNRALGSPVLNNNFSYDQWNKWEVITFGVFLSNFVVPFLDDYESALTVNNNGTKGRGLEAVRFGMGQDSAAEKSLKALIKYTVNAQKNSVREIKVIYNNYEQGKVVSSEEPRTAYLEDLFIRSEVNFWDGFVEIDNIPNSGSIKSLRTVTVGTGATVEAMDKARLGKFVVVGSGEGQSETVFDYSDGWDAQMLGAWISSLANSDYSGEIKNAIQEMLKGDGGTKTPLVFDSFGNICAVYKGRNVVIIPACINQYITDTRSYNLLNSVIFNSGSYVDGSTKSLVNAGLAIDGGDNYNNLAGDLKVIGSKDEKKSSIVKDSDVLIYHDTLTDMATFYNGFDTANKGKNYKDGVGLTSLMNSHLNSESSKLGLRIQVVGGTDPQGLFGRAFDGEVNKLSQHLARVGNLIATTGKISNNAKVMNTLVTDKGPVDLFDSYVYLYVNNSSTYYNAFLDYALKYMDGSMSHVDANVDIDTPSNFRGQLVNASSIHDVARLLYFQGDKVSALMKSFILGGGSYLFKLPKNFSNTLKADMSYSDLISSGITSADGSKLDKDKLVYASSENTWSKRNGRYIKLWTKNSTMVNAMNALSVKKGTEFDVWSRYIYITYLDFYGVLGGGHNFNTHLFNESSDMLNVKPDELFNNVFLTKEEKEAQVLNNTHMLLDLEGGREYRKSFLINLVGDAIQSSYTKLTSSEGGNNFLVIDSYADNPFTGWFIHHYSKILIFLIGLVLIIIVCVTVVQRKSFAWCLVTLIVGVNTLLFIPMLGETVPYITNKVVQRMFSPNMTYYNMAESISNSKLEAENSLNEKTGGSNGLTMSEYIRMLNITSLDRSITAKFDISKKVLEDSTGLINDLQRLESTRWLLPTLMRQFSADDGSANYVYQVLSDLNTNLSNLYWLYNYEDRLNYTTMTSGTIVEGIGNDLSLSSKRSYYDGYQDTSMEGTRSMFNGFENNTSNKQEYMEYTWNSVSRAKDDDEVVHAGFYFLTDFAVPDANGNFEELAKNPPVDAQFILNLSAKLEQMSTKYNIMEGAKAEYGYLWTTESPIYYFYTLVKDTFVSGKSVGGFAGDLQGFYVPSETTGFETRNSFLHYRDTGWVRDVLDLEELFTNVVPYMYSMQVITGGTNGENGVLGDLEITGNEIYDENLKSWMYRSNWVTKLMENKALTSPDIVRGANGEKYKIENPLLPSSYPIERDMIFSEAEMRAKGLSKADLSLAELKMIDINNRVADSWTLLLNYINTPDITTEVFYRQMALEALLVFNTEFNTDKGLFGAKALYPTSLDLRNLSFDAIMKMLLISTTNNSTSIYGDAMTTVIENGSFMSTLLLYVTSWVSISLVPFLRNGLLGLIFFLGLLLLVRNIVGRQKITIIVGFLGTNAIFLACTLLYYGAFAICINTSSADSVLSVGSISVKMGNADILFIMLLAMSCLYAFAIIMLFKFIFKNAYTLGGTAIINGLGVLRDSVGSRMRKMQTKMGSKGGESKGPPKGDSKGDSFSGNMSLDVNINDGKRNKDMNDVNNIYDNASSLGRNMKRSGKSTNYDSKITKSLDNEIAKGKEKLNE